MGTGAAILDYTRPEGIHTHSRASARASQPVYICRWCGGDLGTVEGSGRMGKLLNSLYDREGWNAEPLQKDVNLTELP